MAPSDGGEVVKHTKRRRRELVVDKNNKGNAIDPSSSRSTSKRSSRFRGVSRHRWIGRFEAHLWDKDSWNTTQRKKGKQVYLRAYDEEEAAARAYDLAALKYWGPTTCTNFPVTGYEKELQLMQSITKEEYLASLRRKSSGFSRGVSKYRGVARHHHNGRWETRIGRVFGNKYCYDLSSSIKYLYLGTYGTQEEAAHAYDIAAIEYRGINAVTNFDLSTYIRWLKPGASTTLNRVQGLNVNASGGERFSQHNPFITNDISTCKRECEPRDDFSSSNISNKSSSPTALSLLLKSSMFRQLVEKNTDAGGEEEEDTKDGVCDRSQGVQYVCSSISLSAQSIGLLVIPSSNYDNSRKWYWDAAASTSNM